MSKTEKDQLWKSDQRRQERQQRLESQKSRSGGKKKLRNKVKPGNLILIAILLLIILGLAVNTLLQRGYRERHTTAVTINGIEEPANVLNFYSSLAAQVFGDRFPEGVFSPQAMTALREPSFSGEEGRLVRDDLISYAKQQLASNVLTLQEAKKNAYTFSDKAEEQVDALIKNLRNAASQSGVSLNKMIHLQYGPGNNEETVRELVRDFYHAEEYRQHMEESFKPERAEAEKIYAENPDDYDQVSFRLLQFLPIESDYHDFAEGPIVGDDSSKSEDKDKDEEKEESGKQEESPAKAEHSEEELLANAHQRAEEMASKVKNEADFVKLQELYANPENAKALKENQDVSKQSTSKDKVNEEIGGFLFNPERQAGDHKVVEANGSVWLILYLERGKNEERSYDARHIFFPVPKDAEPAVQADAEKEAQNVLAEYQSGEASEERFAELAEKYSQDPGSKMNGGLYQNVAPGTFVPEFDHFVLAPERKPGDVEIVKSSMGYHIIYFKGLNDEVWLNDLQTKVARNKLTEWLRELTGEVKIEDGKGMKYVLPLN